MAAKILQDKEVPGFIRLNLVDVEKVYERLARHYNSKDPRPIRVGGRARQDALVAAAEKIKSFGHCGCVSTEALAHVYESALIDRDTRSKLGTHSTPPWLVDYIVGRLRPWIEHEIPVERRRVFEPACGHAAFLISAMRLLSEVLPADWHEPRQDYLRQRLRGVEIDPFAIEIARLSLTLADVPNPNGWALTPANMFPADRLERGVREATIVLSNPPFENFDAPERRQGWLPNKAAETFRRVVDHLPQGGVFGFVLPQTFLRSKPATAVRETLIRHYEIAEISQFADKVFRYGDSESAVVIGRRLTQGASQQSSVRCQRIREKKILEFSRTYQPSNTEIVPSTRFVRSDTCSLYVPDMASVWDALSALQALDESALQRLDEFADVGKGFEHKSEDDPTLLPGTVRISPVEIKGMGLTPGFAGWTEQPMTHELPTVVWLNLEKATIRRDGSGTETDIPQILLNYAPASREAWRLKALIDDKGHPVTSRFIVLRPKLARPSLRALWAILNSPIANAYAYCMMGKREVRVKDMNGMPVPDFTQLELTSLENAVADYFDVARTIPVETKQQPRKQRRKEDPRQKLFADMADTEAPPNDALKEQLKILHWRIDAEVLRLYNLPATMEYKILDLFRGIRRRGVPFEQTEYFPKGFTELDRLSDLLAITVDWPKTNRRRAKLIDLEEEGRLTPAQAEELENLQRLADASVSLLQPVQMEDADRIIEDLKRRGLWEE
ncbi:MAG: N-6 DNA methylase [Candidatus Nealsonbacteria bacterium]|nr:N-6 DNA methylase [Candidatus Nealsonbacteria bacterium]